MRSREISRTRCDDILLSLPLPLSPDRLPDLLLFPGSPLSSPSPVGLLPLESHGTCHGTTPEPHGLHPVPSPAAMPPNDVSLRARLLLVEMVVCG